MPAFRSLIDKEWRDVRGISIASLVLVLLGTLAIRFAFLPSNHTYSAAALGEAAALWFVPGMVAVYLAVIASDLVAGDTGSGRIATLALLPVPLGRLFAAKVAALLLLGLVFAVWAITCQLVFLAPAGRPGTALAFLQSLSDAAPRFGVALGFSCAVLFFSTLLRRGFAVALAAAVFVAAIVGSALYVGYRYRDAIEGQVPPSYAAAAVTALALLFVGAAALVFTRGPIHASGLLRRAALGLGVVLGVLVPAGLVSAKALHDYVYFEPGEPGLRLNLLSISPDGRHVVVAAGRQQTRNQHQTWIIDTETSEVVVLDRLGLRPYWFWHWEDEGLFRALDREANPELIRWYDPATGENRRTRPMDRILAGMNDGLQPWGRGWAKTRGRTVTWPARGLSVEMAQGAGADCSPRPGFFLEERDDRVLLHDMSQERTAVVTMIPKGPRKLRYTNFSPNGDYVSIWSPQGRAVADGRTGETLLEVSGDYAINWTGGGSPDRYVLLYGADAPTRLHDLESGHGVELPSAPNRFGYPPQFVRALADGRIVLVDGLRGAIDLRDAAGQLLRTLYAPREN